MSNQDRRNWKDNKQGHYKDNPNQQRNFRDNSNQNENFKKEKTLDDIWESKYLENGYFDSIGCLREEFVKRKNVVRLVEAMAFAEPKPLTNTQLRRFFQHCRYIESNLLSNQSTWECEKTKFEFIDSAAANAFGKKEKKIPKIFHDFIKYNVEKVKTKKDFLDGFMKHFEALVGFSAQYLDEKERN